MNWNFCGLFFVQGGFLFCVLRCFFSPFPGANKHTPISVCQESPSWCPERNLCADTVFFTIYSNWKFDLKDVKWSAVVYIFNIKFNLKIWAGIHCPKQQSFIPPCIWFSKSKFRPSPAQPFNLYSSANLVELASCEAFHCNV